MTHSFPPRRSSDLGRRRGWNRRRPRRRRAIREAGRANRSPHPVRCWHTAAARLPARAGIRILTLGPTQFTTKDQFLMPIKRGSVVLAALPSAWLCGTVLVPANTITPQEALPLTYQTHP